MTHVTVAAPGSGYVTTPSVTATGCGTTGCGSVDAFLASGFTLNASSVTTTAQDGITLASTGQSNAVALTQMLNRVNPTVGSGAASLPTTSAILISSGIGSCVTVINGSATNATQIYGSGGTDTINGAAYATGVSLPAGKTAQYCTVAAGSWNGGYLN
jgi:acetate kinase